MRGIVEGVLLFASLAHGFPQKRAAIDDCLTSAQVPIYASGSSNFTQAIKPFNLRLPFTPTALAVPSTVAQVQAAVSCGASLGITISPKSGGHSYASHGLGGEDGHLVIDLKLFNNVSVDSTTGIATVAPGARLGNVASALYSQGKRAMSHGTCPGVGAGGHVLHGGYGFASHTHGLAMDLLVEAQVVIADGSVVTASKTQNSDLFWALRGAGSSYGVVTQMKFQTFAAPTSITVFSYTYDWDEAQAVTALAALQDYANGTSIPAEMNMRLSINPYSTKLGGVFYGTQEAFQSAIAPLVAKIGSPQFSSVDDMDWVGMLNNFAYVPLKTPLNYNAHETFFAKSLMTEYLTQSAIASFVHYWYTTAKSVNRDWYCRVYVHGGPTSAVSKVPVADTAYAHRTALLEYEFYDAASSGSYPSDGFSFLNDWVNGVTSAMANVTFGMYYNYADSSLTAPQAHSAYWMKHYDQLVKVKQIYDPKKVFGNPQAVLSG